VVTSALMSGLFLIERLSVSAVKCEQKLKLPNSVILQLSIPPYKHLSFQPFIACI
jgi:hypothetical protein